MFFSEKRNQKAFTPSPPQTPALPAWTGLMPLRTNRSLFASFSSEKEDS
jgi:hypothetical protein